ncbi:hypothetical protein BC629DRAFT_1648407 [Irpex lacteus]|nr:hypothetical protein BC629DRAFT_1648407 [Irpex lacteus]
MIPKLLSHTPTATLYQADQSLGKSKNAKYIQCSSNISWTSAAIEILRLDSESWGKSGLVSFPEFVSYLKLQHTANYFRIAAIVSTAEALSVYEYVITLPQERRLMWQRKLSLASVLFFVNRYAIILENALMLASMAIWAGPDTSLANRTCAVMSILAIVCGCLIILSLTVFASVRTYVLWNCNKWIFALVLFLGLIKPICAIYLISSIKLPAHDPYSTHSCLFYANVPSVGHMLEATPNAILVYRNWLSSASYFTFESVVLGLTWAKTIPALRVLRSTKIGFRQSLFYIMSRDGTSQFVQSQRAPRGEHSEHTVLRMAAYSTRHHQPLYFPLILSDTIVSIAISRFILNLRRPLSLRKADVRDPGHTTEQAVVVDFLRHVGVFSKIENEPREQDGCESKEFEKARVQDPHYDEDLGITGCL